MEDYTIGSLAELISGQKNEKKRKLIVKKLPAKKPRVTKDVPSTNDNIESKQEETPNLKKKKSKKNTLSACTEKPENKSCNNSQKPVKRVHNAERRIKQKDKVVKKSMDGERNSRTIFLGNVPLKIKKQAIKKLCMKFGTVEAVRLRCAPVADPRVPKKVAVIKQEFHPTRTSIHSFVRFSSREEAEKALTLNGQLYEGHHLRAKLCDEEKVPDEHNAIFVGNIHFGAEEEDLWKIFESVGTISSVRLIRDARTGLGKGFGYVNFESPDSVELVLQMEPPVLKNRELRISSCNTNLGKKLKKKKEKGNSEEKRPFTNIGSKDNKKTKNTSFQGSKFTDKKKHKKKISKEALKKKNLIRQLVKTSN